jgi:hypothetical protein
MSNPPIPGFEVALDQFRAFISEMGYSANSLVWIFREDVSTNRRRVLIKVPLPHENERVARTRYEQGRALGIGVCLEVFCQLESALCCSTWFVKDLEESTSKLCYGLKLSVPPLTDLVIAEPVQNSLDWALRSQLDSRSEFNQFRDFLPERDA